MKQPAHRIAEAVRDVLSLPQSGPCYRRVMALAEEPLIVGALRKCGGNQVRAARMLGINRNTLRAKLRRYVG